MYNDLILNHFAALQPDQDSDAQIQSLIDEIEELDNLLGPEAQELIKDLRPRTVTDDVYEEIDESATFSDRLADSMADHAGSWTFIILFVVIMIVWVGANILLGVRAFDPYPFILLNLGLSTLAALQAPVILMSQNRQADKDRAVARNDYEVNIKSELELVDLHRKLDVLTGTIELQGKLINALANARRQEVSATVNAIEKSRNSNQNNGKTE